MSNFAIAGLEKPNSSVFLWCDNFDKKFWKKRMQQTSAFLPETCLFMYFVNLLAIQLSSCKKARINFTESKSA